MGFFEKFFIIEEETKQKPTPVDIKSIVGQADKPVVVTKADLSDFINHFKGLFEKENLPGPDYYEFFKMLDVMGDIGEDAKVRASFAALSSQGLTKDKLVSTAEHYLNVIEKDKNDFTLVIDTTVSEEVNEKEKEIELLSNKIKSNNSLIEQFKAENITSSKSIEKLKQEVTSQKASIVDKKQSYEQASNGIIAKIQKDIQLIKSNI